MFILKKGYQPGVYVPLRALFLVFHKLNNASADCVFIRAASISPVTGGIPNQKTACIFPIVFSSRN